jgi:DNA-binding transcriptional LysR family regulator
MAAVAREVRMSETDASAGLNWSRLSAARKADMKQEAVLDQLPGLRAGVHQGLELRHLRYLIAVADAGTFTQAAEQIFIAQPTLSQQIRRLEEMVGTPLLQRRRDGVRLTAAGQVLLEESRVVLSLIDRGVSRSRQAAGLGRPRLRVVLPPYLPDALAVEITSRLQSVAAAAGADVTWMETPLDAGFSLIRQRRADAGLGWLTPALDVLPDSLEVMSLGEFEPEVWVPSSAGSDQGGTISLDELARMRVIHGPRRASAATYDSWLTVLRTGQPRFEFTDPPFRHSLPMTLAFAATASRPIAVLTGPLHPAEAQITPVRRQPPAGLYDMVRVSIEGRPLTATAALAWNGDLPRELQQILFDTAACALTGPGP